jgi:iron-sulfur cluster assembly protein
MTDATAQHVVHLTEAAQAAARRFLAEEAEPEGKALRVGVNAGGCSGFTYHVAIDVKKADDFVQDYEGFQVVVDNVSKQFINDAKLDYVDDIGHAGFKFDNPQASSSCGCGMSFDV